MAKDAGCPVNMVPSLTPTLVSRLVLTVPDAAPVLSLFRQYSQLRASGDSRFLYKVQEAADGHMSPHAAAICNVLVSWAWGDASVGIKYLLCKHEGLS